MNAMSTERKQRFLAIAEDPVAVAVVNLQRPNDAKPFDNKKVMAFMKADSEAFANKITRVLKGSLAK